MNARWVSFASLIPVLGLFLANPIAALAGVEPRSFENRALAPFPEARMETLADGAFMEDLGDFISDRMPLRPVLVAAANWSDYHLLKDSPVPDVALGKKGWIFLAKSIRNWPCQDQSEPIKNVGTFRSIERALAGRDDFIVAISPAKATIYPEFLSDEDTSKYAECLGPRQQALEAFMEESESKAFINLWRAFRAEKARMAARNASSDEEERLNFLYRPRDRHWHVEGGRLQARRIVERLQPGAWDEAAVPKISKGWVIEEAELSKRFVKLDLQEVYRKLGARPTQTDVTREKVPGVKRKIERHRSTWPAAQPGRLVIVHDSFMMHSKAFITPFFEETVFVHWKVYEKDPDVVRDLVRSAGKVVLQSVEGHSGWRMDALLDLAATR